jgi:hypothetical protein
VTGEPATNGTFGIADGIDVGMNDIVNSAFTDATGALFVGNFISTTDVPPIDVPDVYSFEIAGTLVPEPASLAVLPLLMLLTLRRRD